MTWALSDVDEVLIDAPTIQQRVAELGRLISLDYAGRNPLLIGLLRGTIFFMADLQRAISIPCQIDYLSVASYGPQARKSGVVRFMKDVDEDIGDRHVLLIEDVVDTGLTLRYVLRMLNGRNPASLAICALLDKPVRRLVNIDVAYCGFTIPDKFVVGYGLDYLQQYRNLPSICVLKKEVYLH